MGAEFVHQQEDLWTLTQKGRMPVLARRTAVSWHICEMCHGELAPPKYKNHTVQPPPLHLS